jgi:hypothetical protein
MKTMPVIQSRQIVDMLNSLRAKGEVRNATEYQQALLDLSNLVNAENPVPSFEQIKAIAWYLASSDAHNIMMQSATNDIEALFAQTDEINQRIEDQHVLIMRSMMSELEKVISEQEDSIRRFQLIGSSHTEFTDVLLNSFSSTNLKRISRSEPAAVDLFFNNRDGKIVSENIIPDAEVSPNGKKLTLPTTEEPRILPLSVSLLTDEESYQSIVNSSVNNNISNIIDGTSGTFWTRTVYLDKPVERVSTPLKFNLGNGADINYVIIQGASQYPFYIADMWGIAPDGHRINLMLRRATTSIDSSSSTQTIPLEEEVYVDGSVRIDFEQVFVKDVHIRFVYSSYEEGDFWVDSAIGAQNIFEDNTALTIEDIAPQIKESLLSKDLSDKLGVPKNIATHINSNVYHFALDNVWFGNGLYTDSAIFVSEPLLVENPGVVSIQSKERNVGERNVLTEIEIPDDEEDQKINAGSAEYELIRKRINKDGLYVIDHFPIPYLGQEKVFRERFIPIKLHDTTNSSIMNNAGPLRFCPRISTYSSVITNYWDGEDIEVYKNDQKIFLGSGANQYQVAFQLDPTGKTTDLNWTDNPGIDIYNFSNWNIPQKRLWILINSPSPNDVYTITYNIRTSLRSNLDKDTFDLSTEQCVVYLDKNRTVRMEEDGKLMFIKDAATAITDRSELFLQISLRRNTASKAFSPEILEFALLVAPYQ